MCFGVRRSDHNPTSFLFIVVFDNEYISIILLLPCLNYGDLNLMAKST